MMSVLMPHTKKKLKATDVLPFPWDNKPKKNIKRATKEQIAEDVARHKKILLKKKK
jgi:hypothetical protein